MYRVAYIVSHQFRHFLVHTYIHVSILFSFLTAQLKLSKLMAHYVYVKLSKLILHNAWVVYIVSHQFRSFLVHT